jgi:hypothetical protein
MHPRALFPALLAVLLPAAALAAEPADLVFRGGPIHTADDARPTAEAVAVDEGRIVYVGPAAGLAPFIGRGTRVVELRGASLYPASPTRTRTCAGSANGS